VQVSGLRKRLFIEGHHIEHWASGGETSLDNLVGLCSHHHRFVHEYGYSIEIDATMKPRFFEPRGRRVVEAPLPPVNAYRGWDIITDANLDLNITSETTVCGWTADRSNTSG